MTKIALFPGSFDPFTNGHLNTVERAAELFDEVIIAVVTNTTKVGLFTSDEKIELINLSISHLDNVEVIAQAEGLTVDIAEELGAKFLVRGIRNMTDYEYEKNIASMNKQLKPSVETVFLMADDRLSNVSSSIIKEIAKFKGDITAFVPSEVEKAIAKKFFG
ncbi:pantetheine-phosphate adenylyltransferase [Vagococcus sp. PNs007]|uniref:Phosphopantetheine adenylyltransferase n=1 Tax=Vagococcus proximus TaxID=2991417 RepID=A0ABT5WYB3_9ENTE|nr:pantetheine-phosphate adenylyltransferase [Vagococcus proximus]MDF0478671.1 pantetheine-phosphate adenylyltransferase [Vagococcus proximus]